MVTAEFDKPAGRTPFDFALPGVTSMMTDGHKLGLMPISTGFFIVRDPSLFDAVPTEPTLIQPRRRRSPAVARLPPGR